MEAVKFTVVPSHVFTPCAEAIEMVGAAVGLTVIVMLLLIAVAGLGHVTLLTISQVTTSPLFNELVT